MAFAKLKALLRAAAARTIPDLWQAIADALRRFTPQECANYLAAAGYDATRAENALTPEHRHTTVGRYEVCFWRVGSSIEGLAIALAVLSPPRILRWRVSPNAVL